MYAILGYGDLLVAGEYGALTEEGSEVVERMRTSSMSLLDLFTATLDLSRLEQSAIPLDLEAIRVEDLTAPLELETRMLAKPTVDVIWEVPSDLPIVRTDRIKLKILLRNLVGNALKFTEQGTVDLTSAARSAEASSSRSPTPGRASLRRPKPSCSSRSVREHAAGMSATEGWGWACSSRSASSDASGGP